MGEKRRLRIKELERQMASMTKDRNEKERLIREKSQREKQMERMRAELEQLKKKKVDLVKQAKENQKKVPCLQKGQGTRDQNYGEG